MLKIIHILTLVKEANDKDPNFEFGDHIRISRYDIYAKGYTPNWSEEAFVIKEVKILFHGHMLLMVSVINDEEMTGTFYEKEPHF